MKECKANYFNLWPITAISGQVYEEGSDMSIMKVFCQSYSLIFQSVCLSVCLSASLSACLPACLSVCQASSICPSFCSLSVYLSAFTHLTILLFSVCLCQASSPQFTLWPIPSMRCACRESWYWRSLYNHTHKQCTVLEIIHPYQI